MTSLDRRVTFYVGNLLPIVETYRKTDKYRFRTGRPAEDLTRIGGMLMVGTMLRWAPSSMWRYVREVGWASTLSSEYVTGLL